MLKQRVLTALVLGVLVIGSVLLLPSLWFSLIVLAALCYAGWEWSRLIALTSTAARTGFVATIIVLTLLSAPHVDSLAFIFTVFSITLLFWIFAVQRLLRFASNPGAQDSRIVGVVCGLFTLVPTWVALVALHRGGEAGPGYVLLLLALVWAADTGAYFAGKRWGRRKLAPTISPGKTVEGVYGGVAAALGIAIVGYFALDPQTRSLALFVAIALATVAFSVLGDLFESMVKRQRSLKDSGSLLPGHGGMLDRIDSLTAAAPFFALGMLGGGG